MKPTVAIAILSSALAALPARGLLLTTWRLPGNERALREETASDVAVLSVRRSIDESAAVAIYRTDAPGSLAAGAGADGNASAAGRGALSAAFVENAAAGFALVRASGVRRRAAGTVFSAADEAANYDNERPWDLGDNGGTGFAPWMDFGGQSPARSFKDGDFAVSGDGAAGRPFESGVQFDEGTFGVEAVHEFTDMFSGFAVYAADSGDGYGELLRWGVTVDEDTGRARFCTAVYTGGQNRYVFFGDSLSGEGSDASVSVEYALAWEAIETGLQFQVSATTGAGTFSSGWLQVADAGAVAAVGVVTAGGSESKFLRFDHLSATGHVIPEPGTLSLLLAGAALLSARRRKARGGLGF